VGRAEGDTRKRKQELTCLWGRKVAISPSGTITPKQTALMKMYPSKRPTGLDLGYREEGGESMSIAWTSEQRE
jgi:hypothetical protein